MDFETPDLEKQSPAWMDPPAAVIATRQKLLKRAPIKSFTVKELYAYMQFFNSTWLLEDRLKQTLHTHAQAITERWCSIVKIGYTNPEYGLTSGNFWFGTKTTIVPPAGARQKSKPQTSHDALKAKQTIVKKS